MIKFEFLFRYTDIVPEMHRCEQANYSISGAINNVLELPWGITKWRVEEYIPDEENDRYKMVVSCECDSETFDRITQKYEKYKNLRGMEE